MIDIPRTADVPFEGRDPIAEIVGALDNARASADAKLAQEKQKAESENAPYQALIAQLHDTKSQALADFNGEYLPKFRKLQDACVYAAHCCSALNVPFNYKEVLTP